MKIFCEYCGSPFDDTLTECPQCGAPSKGVNRTVQGEPVTIEQLQQWYADRGLPPYETTRFFIGEDYKGNRAFGIYKDPSSGNFVVYKNKDDGSRAVRYEGSDEAYAVNELYMRLKQEILEQKAHNLSKIPQKHAQAVQRNTASNSAASQTGNNKPKKSNRKVLWIVLAVLGVFFLPLIIWLVVDFINFTPTGQGSETVYVAETKDPSVPGYYKYQDTTYYRDTNDSWYTFDTSDNDWVETPFYEVPDDLQKKSSADDFYYTPDWNSQTQVTDFTDSTFYKENHSTNNTSTWDNSNDDSSYDWSSDDSWSSDSSDWDSDW